MVALRDMGRDVTGVEMKRITNEDKDAIRVVGAGDGPWPLLLTAFSETTDEFIAKLLRTVAKSQH
jgi:hypothetical protein